MSRNPLTTVEAKKIAADIAVQRALKYDLVHVTPLVEVRADRFRIASLLLLYKARQFQRGVPIRDKEFITFVCDLLVLAADDNKDKGKRVENKLKKVMRGVV